MGDHHLVCNRGHTQAVNLLTYCLATARCGYRAVDVSRVDHLVMRALTVLERTCLA